MGNEKVKCSVELERLVIDFLDEHRAVFINGSFEGEEFHIRAEDFETNLALSDSDKRHIRQILMGSNIVID